MTDPEATGLALLVWQAGPRSNWNMDLASLRPFVRRVLLADAGGGAYLQRPLRRCFPDTEVDYLHLPASDPVEERTRLLRRGIGGERQWVLVLRAGTNASIDRRFRLPDSTSPQSAVHIVSSNGEAYWRPVLAMNEPGRFTVRANGEISVNADFTECQCNDELIVHSPGPAAGSSRMLMRELEHALARFREDESPEIVLEIAECHFRLRKYPEAEFWYRRYIDRTGDDSRRWLGLYRIAQCLSARESRWPDVESAMAAAFDTDPNRAEPLYHIARHYQEAGRYSKAYELAAVGLEIQPPRSPLLFEYPVYQYKLPLVYMACATRLGKDRNCADVANRVLRRPGVPEAARVEAAGYRGTCIDRLQPVYPVSVTRKNDIVVISAFRNPGSFLQACADSLIAQDYPDCRMILIDDASTDGAVDRLKVDDPRLAIERREQRWGAVRNQIDAVSRHCKPDDIVVYVDGDDRLVHDSVLGYINGFFNATRCWIMYGQYRRSDDRYGTCEPIVADPEDFLAAMGEMHFPMHIRAHRAGLIHHLLKSDPDLSRLRDDDGVFLDSIADMALMRALMQLAGPEHVRYNDTILYEYNCRNPESHYSEYELKRLQDHQSRILSRRQPLEAVTSWRPDEATRPLRRPNHSKTRLLFIGLDALSPDLARRWGSEGLLPNLQQWFGTGSARNISSPEGFGNDVFWISLGTGKLPDENGYYFRNYWNPERYSFHRYDPVNRPASQPDVTPFWSRLADSDLELAVIDFPEVRTAGHVNGLEVVEWMTHARIAPPRFHPHALEEDWITRFGNDPSGGNTETLKPRNGEQFARVRDELLSSVDQKTRAALHYLDRGGWDFFAVAYSQAHDMGHQFWHVHDTGHPGHRPVWRQRYGDPLLQAYQALDEAVGRVVEGAGAGARVVLVAGLALGVKVSCNPVLDRVLFQLEKAEYGRAAGADDLRDLKNRRFFAVPHNNVSGAVRLNLKGRERSGLVNPGEEYDRVLSRLQQRLHEITNADTGGPVVSKVVRTHDKYHGPRVDDIPDLVVIWSRTSPLKRISAPWCEEHVRPRDVVDTRTGDHVDGAALATNLDMSSLPAGEVPVESIAPWLESLIADRQG